MPTQVQTVVRALKARGLKVTKVYLHRTGKIAVSILRDKNFSFPLMGRIRDALYYLRGNAEAIEEHELTHSHLFLVDFGAEAPNKLV